MEALSPNHSLDSNDTFCNHSIKYELRPLLTVFGSTGIINAVVTLIAIAAMIFCRFHKQLTHRLIINMLVSVFVFCIVAAAQLTGLWRHYWKGEHLGECVAGGFFIEYFMWVMLLSTLMMTVHLTSMVMFPLYYKKVAKLQPVYLLFPWIFPLLIIWIPLVHNNYGLSGAWCWIRLYNEDCSANKEGLVEMYALLYGELIIGLILNNIGLLVIAITLCKRSCSTNEMSSGYRKALKQALPLVVYPITYQFLSIFAIADRMYQLTHHGHYVKWLIYAQAISGPCCGIFAPIVTLIYLLILHKVIKENLKKHNWCCKSDKQQNVDIINYSSRDTKRLLDSEDHLTQYGSDTVTSPTHYLIPRESEYDEEYGKVFIDPQ